MADEKLKNAEMNEEELDQVAGGSYKENLEILSTLGSLKPELAEKISSELQSEFVVNPKGTLNDLLSKYLAPELKGTGYHRSGSSDKFANMYSFNGKKISHEEFLQGLKTIYGGDDF